MKTVLMQLQRAVRFWLSKVRGNYSPATKAFWVAVGIVPICCFCSICTVLLPSSNNPDTPERETMAVRRTVVVATAEATQPTRRATSVAEAPTPIPAQSTPTTRPTQPAEAVQPTATVMAETPATLQPPAEVVLTSTTPPLPSATSIPSPTSQPTVPPAPRTVGAAVVTAITDGDTVTVEVDGSEYTVRYIGMDTPERGDPFYTEATQANRNLVLGKEVWLEKDVNETDRFGRLLRYVYVGDVLINEELVRTGYAQASAYPPDVRYQERLDAAERVARESGVGLWAVAVVVPTEIPVAPTEVSVATEIPPAPVPPTEAPPPPAPGGSDLVIVAVNKRDEYADIRNSGATPLDLRGWILRSERGSQDCALGGVIQPGETLRIWAMSGAPGFSCGFGDNIWNNSENDDGVLINPQGQEAYRFDA